MEIILIGRLQQNNKKANQIRLVNLGDIKRSFLVILLSVFGIE